jgi:hypothetical protein
MKKHSIFAGIFLVLLAGLSAAESAAPWDSGRYIRVNEIKMDMPAYCLSVIKGDKVDKFNLKILSIVRNVRPQKDMILVVITDERMKNTGAVHGCSGSPVYIDGRMAGAMAAGWEASLEPMYLVTPIENMLSIGKGAAGITNNNTSAQSNCYVEAYSSLNLNSVARLAMEDIQSSRKSTEILPLSTNLSFQACKALGPMLETTGLVPIQSGESAGVSSNATMEPGGVLALPLCSGDIQMAVTGTVTEVAGSKVYGFGHAFTGMGATELPMSSGTVHSIIATQSTSFKLSSPGQILGTLCFDHNDGVVGIVGRQPELIDLEIKVNRFDDPQQRIFRCKVAKDRQLTPLVLRSAIMGAALNQGDLPAEHNIRYRGEVQLANGQTIRFENFSSGESVQAPVTNTFALASALMNNPFQSMPPKKVSIEIDILAGNRAASLMEMRLSKNTVSPGETITVYAKIKEFRSESKELAINFHIPADCPEGRYSLQVLGVDGYQNFLTKNAQQRFLVTDAKSLLAGLGMVLNIPSDRVYVCMSTAQSGISIRNAELADLPQSKTALLADSKRILPVAPYQNFIETNVQTDFVLNGAGAADVIIEKNP